MLDVPGMDQSDCCLAGQSRNSSHTGYTAHHRSDLPRGEYSNQASFWEHLLLISKGPSKNVNILMSVQTVHFFRPPPLKLYRSTHWVPYKGLTQHKIYSATINLNHLQSLLCDK